MNWPDKPQPGPADESRSEMIVQRVSYIAWTGLFSLAALALFALMLMGGLHILADQHDVIPALGYRETFTLVLVTWWLSLGYRVLLSPAP